MQRDDYVKNHHDGHDGPVDRWTTFSPERCRLVGILGGVPDEGGDTCHPGTNDNKAVISRSSGWETMSMQSHYWFIVCCCCALPHRLWSQLGYDGPFYRYSINIIIMTASLKSLVKCDGDCTYLPTYLSFFDTDSNNKQCPLTQPQTSVTHRGRIWMVVNKWNGGNDERHGA